MNTFKIILAAMLIAPLGLNAGGIVNNAGTSSEDSVSFIVYSLDSLGNPTAADSFFVLVHGPNGDSVFAEAITVASPRLDSSQLAGFPAYAYCAAVADIDGPGRTGVYSIAIVAKRNSPLLRTPSVGSFQITGWELDDMGDSTGLAAVNSERAVDSLHLLIDSLSAVLDTLRSQDDWIGGSLDDILAGLGGSGAYAVTLTALDTCLSEAIPGAQIAIRNLEQTALIAVGRTNSEGRLACNLDAGSYLAVGLAPGYIFRSYDTLVVSSSAGDTLTCCRFDPGTPASPSLCRVFGVIYNAAGRAEAGATISASLPKGVCRVGDAIISPFPVMTRTDSTGYFAIDLIPSCLLSGDDTRYDVTIGRSDGSILRKRLSVPQATCWQMTW
jgi:hypothetical protein